MTLTDIALLIVMWSICTVIGAAYIGVIAAIAWKVAQWLL